jgi:rod shape-determining protein MreD
MSADLAKGAAELKGPAHLGFVLFTLFCAFLLNILPWPGWVWSLRPDWLLLVVLYWNVHLPSRVGLSAAFAAGLLMDVTEGTLLGMHGLAYLPAAYAASVLSRRILNFKPWQQALHVLPMLVLADLLLVLLGTLAGSRLSDWLQPFSGLIGFLLWPLLDPLFHLGRRKAAGDKARPTR